MLLKLKVEAIDKLQKEIDDFMVSMEDHALEVCRRYIDAETYDHSAQDYPRSGAFFTWRIAPSTPAMAAQVLVVWDGETGFADQNEGSFEFPAKYLYDEKALVAFEKKQHKRHKGVSAVAETREPALAFIDPNNDNDERD